MVEILTSTDDLEDVRQLIIMFGDKVLTFTDRFGNVSLHYAQSADIARLLIEGVSDESALLVARNDDNQSILHAASIFGRQDVIGYLGLALKRKNSFGLLEWLLTASDLYGNTPLHYADTKDTSVSLLYVSEFVDLKVDLKMQCNKEGKNPLHKACEDGREDVIECLLDGVDGESNMLLATDDLGNTALHYCGTSKTADLLLSVCDENTRHHRAYHTFNHLGQSAIHTACGREHNTEAIKYLLALEDSKESLMPHLKKQDKNMNTPLHLAIDCGNGEITEFILEQYANSDEIINELLSQRNNLNRNALHIALQGDAYTKKKMLKVFKDYSECLNYDEMLQADDQGQSPIHMLAGSSHPSDVKHFSRLILRLKLPRRRTLVHNNNPLTYSRSISICDQELSSDKEGCLMQSLDIESSRKLNLDCIYSNLINTWQQTLTCNELPQNADPRLLQMMLYALNQFPTSFDPTKSNLLPLSKVLNSYHNWVSIKS